MLSGPPALSSRIAYKDLAIAKDTKIKERVSLQFRSEAFNLFNHPNFGQPQNNLAVASFSQITATCPSSTPRALVGRNLGTQFTRFFWIPMVSASSA
jgi:hypothetical protein